MPTTSNFGWTTPADTDLVKDGAAAIRTLGNGIDTSLVDLKGGTTGQILSKATNTDLDYTWITPNVGDITEVQAGTGISVASGTGPIPVITNTVATAFDAAGDLVYGTGADTFTKLALGSAGQVLTVNSGATAPEWKNAAGGGKVLQVVNSTLATTATTNSTSYVDTGLSATITPSSTASKILILVSATCGGDANGAYSHSFTITKGTTNLIVPTSPSNRTPAIITLHGTDGQLSATMHNLNTTFLDSPATTSATEYRLRFLCSIAGHNTTINRSGTDTDSASFGRSVSSMTLLEIGA